MVLSLVIPVFNESEGINEFHNLLIDAVKKASKSFEIIYVNDGSKDNSLEILTSLATNDPRVKLINLSRNFGKEIALTAGIHLASGDAIMTLDADGQHPPALIHEFVKKWKSGSQVVVGVRNSNQKEGVVKKVGSKLFYKLFNSLTESSIIPRSTDFRLIDRLVQQEFINFTERHRITRGLIDWLGFKRDYVYFDAPSRIAGEASYKTSQLVKLALNSFISLSLKPLFFFGWVGVVIIGLSTFFGLFIFIEQYILGDPLSLNFTGTALLGVFMSFLVGLVLVSQSILATYVSHIHAQTQARPLFVVDKSQSKNLF